MADPRLSLILNGKEVRRLRLLKGWSQADLARQAGIHMATVSQGETSSKPVAPATLRKLAKALGADPLGIAEVVEASA